MRRWTGYSRVLLAGASLYFMSYHPNYCAILYSLSCLLDALDGYAARKFNQATKFGAVLDMVTDRCTTACLLVFLSAAYTNYAVLFQVLISLDLASHYMHMYVVSLCVFLLRYSHRVWTGATVALPPRGGRFTWGT